MKKLDPYTIRVLASAFKKFAPDLAEELMKRWQEANSNFDVFMAYLKIKE